MRLSAKRLRGIYYSVRRLLDRDEFVSGESGGKLTFGICLLNRFTIADRNLQVMGDELQARAVAREVLLHCPQVKKCKIYDIKEADNITDDIVFVMWPDYPVLKRRPQKYVFWLQNAGFENRLPEFMRTYDCVFSPSRKLCAEFPGVIYLPMACEDAASFKKTAPEDKFSCDVCFVGNYTEEQRLERFQREYLLPAARYRFGLWGTNWERSGIKEIREAAKGRLEPADIARAYSSAKIVLASHCFVHREEEIITTRIYEALASESFVISDYFKALDEFSDHLVFTTGGKDLDDKLRYYLSNPEARSKKTKGARELILRNHTFKNRVEIIAKNIGIEFR